MKPCYGWPWGCSLLGTSLNLGEKPLLQDLMLMDVMFLMPSLRLQVWEEFWLGQWAELSAVLDPNGRREAEVGAGQTQAVPFPGLYWPASNLFLDLIEISLSCMMSSKLLAPKSSAKSACSKYSQISRSLRDVILYKIWLTLRQVIFWRYESK